MLNKYLSEISQNKNLLMLLTAGIYSIALYSVLSEQILLFSMLLLLISIIAIVKNYFPCKYIIVWNLLFYLGILNTSCRIKDVDELLSLAPVNCEISGTVVSIPKGKTEGTFKFFFEVDKLNIKKSLEKKFDKEKVLVTLNSTTGTEDLKLYSSLRLKGRLSMPFKAGNPSQFDYGNYLRNHNAYSVFYAKSFEHIDKHLSVKAKILRSINDYRENIIKKHSKYLASPNLEILGGIVFGDDAVSPSKDIKDSFVASGLLHILAASGMNVAFIYTFFYWFLSLFKINYRLRVILGMLMVIVYTLMTGLGASVIRASSMLLFVLIGKLIDRDAHSISLLSFVALLMLLYNPLFINDVGFQLSFVVTFGILLMTPIIAKSEHKVIDYFAGVVMIPVIAQIWVIPVQIFYFNNISVYSVFANIMSVPILAVISFGGFVSSLLAGITPIADFVCKVFDFVLNPLITLLVNISDFWGQLPKSMIQTSHPSTIQLLLYYLIILVITFLFHKSIREKFAKTLLIVFIVFSSLLLLSIVPVKNNSLEIITFDVGSADCFLIKTPENKYIMIDTAKSGYASGKSQAEIIVLKYLKDRGIKSLESIILTHFDNDHCGGAVDIINNLKLNNVYVNTKTHSSKAANDIYLAADNRQVEIVEAYNNQVIYDLNDLKLTNLLGPSSDNDNENSIITLLEYKNFTMLFTGDVSSRGLKSVINSIPTGITVLKVPHHGASDSLDKTIMNYLSPEISIISVGENKFGHPSVYTLEMLKNTKIYRTDIHNSIKISVKKNDYSIYAFDLKRKKYILKEKPSKEG